MTFASHHNYIKKEGFIYKSCIRNQCSLQNKMTLYNSMLLAYQDFTILEVFVVLALQHWF